MFLKTGASPFVYLLHEGIFDFFAVVTTPVIHIKEFETFLRNCIDSLFFLGIPDKSASVSLG